MLNKFKKLSTVGKGVLNYNLVSRFGALKPTEMQINVTYNCNSHCQMCHIWQMKPQNEMNFDEWQNITKDPIFKNIERLLLAGGEPTLNPDLVKLTQVFLDSMPKLKSLNIVTNGFTKERVLSCVKSISELTNKRKVDFSVSVSLDGLGKMHETIRRIPEAFEKVSGTILKLKGLEKKCGFSLGVSGVISHLNLGEIEEVEKWCQDKDIPFSYQIIGFHKTFVNNLEEKNKLEFTQDDKVKLADLLKNLANRKSINDLRSFLRSYYWQDMFFMAKGKQRTTPCPFVFDAFVLDSFGDVYYCLSEPKIGNCRPKRHSGGRRPIESRGDPIAALQDDKYNVVSSIYFDKKNLELRQKRAKTICLTCNSGCFVTSGIAKDFKKLAWFLLTGKVGLAGAY